MRIKIILPASEIPNESIVTKKTGTQEYKLVDCIFMYDENGIKQKLTVDNEIKDIKYMVSLNNIGINAVSGKTELVWITTTQAISDWILRNDYDNYDEKDY